MYVNHQTSYLSRQLVVCFLPRVPGNPIFLHTPDKARGPYISLYGLTTCPSLLIQTEKRFGRKKKLTTPYTNKFVNSLRTHKALSWGSEKERNAIDRSRRREVTRLFGGYVCIVFSFLFGFCLLGWRCYFYFFFFSCYDEMTSHNLYLQDSTGETVVFYLLTPLVIATLFENTRVSRGGIGRDLSPGNTKTYLHEIYVHLHTSIRILKILQRPEYRCSLELTHKRHSFRTV